MTLQGSNIKHQFDITLFNDGSGLAIIREDLSTIVLSTDKIRQQLPELLPFLCSGKEQNIDYEALYTLAQELGLDYVEYVY